jgi:hypothetical protein
MEEEDARARGKSSRLGATLNPMEGARHRPWHHKATICMVNRERGPAWRLTAIVAYAKSGSSSKGIEPLGDHALDERLGNGTYGKERSRDFLELILLQ